MDATHYLSRLDRLAERNRALLLGLLIMFGWNIFNWTAMTAAKAHEKIVIAPVIGGSGLWLGGGKASTEYIRAMSRYITGQIGNYTAATVRKQLQEILTLFPSDRIGEVQVEFERLAAEVERYPSISSQLLWSGEEPLKYDDDLIQIEARRNRLVNGNTTKTEHVFICIDYRISDVRFEIERISERTGDGVDLCFYGKESPNHDSQAAR